MRALEPFRKVGAERLRAYVNSSIHEAGMIKATIKGHELTGYDESRIQELEEARIKEAAEQAGIRAVEDRFWHEREWRLLLEPVLQLLPDMEISINKWDEPRVLQDELATDSDADFVLKSHKSAVAELVTRPCRSFDGAVREYSKDPFSPYLSDLIASKEICLHQDVASYYGMIRNPYTLSLTSAPVPILSQSKLSTTGALPAFCSLRSILLTCTLLQPT